MNARIARFAALTAAAEVGHQVGDFILQTDRQATHKAAPGHNPPWVKAEGAATWRANQAHCLGYHLALTASVAAVCGTLGVRVRPGRAVAALALSWGTHALLDRRWPVELIMRAKGCPPDADLDAVKLGVDQAGHRAALLAACLIASK